MKHLLAVFCLMFINCATQVKQIIENDFHKTDDQYGIVAYTYNANKNWTIHLEVISDKNERYQFTLNKNIGRSITFSLGPFFRHTKFLDSIGNSPLTFVPLPEGKYRVAYVKALINVNMKTEKHIRKSTNDIFSVNKGKITYLGSYYGDYFWFLYPWRFKITVKDEATELFDKNGKGIQYTKEITNIIERK